MAAVERRKAHRTRSGWCPRRLDDDKRDGDIRSPCLKNPGGILGPRVREIRNITEAQGHCKPKHTVELWAKEKKEYTFEKLFREFE